MSHKDLLLRLLPIRLGGDFDLDLETEAGFLDSLQSLIEGLHDDLLGPAPSAETVLRREALFGIVPPYGSTLDERRAAVAAAWQKTGGLSKPYFTGLAAALGYTVTIEDMRPFEAGIGMAGYSIWDPGIKWCWTVRVASPTPDPSFFVGKTAAAYTSAGDPYLWTWDAVAGPMESLFNSLKPPGGVVLFLYQTA